MKFFAAWWLLSFGGVAGDEVTPKALEGVWVGARFTEGNGADEKKGVKLIITFKGDQVAVQKWSRSLVGKATYKIASDGKSVDAVGASGAYRKKTYVGILKIEGDKLYWCISGTGTRDKQKKKDRPTGYTANPGRAEYLIVAKRLKK